MPLKLVIQASNDCLAESEIGSAVKVNSGSDVIMNIYQGNTSLAE